MMNGKTLIVVTAIALAMVSSAGWAAPGGKPGKPGVTGEEDTAGNNLSFPVIWSDGVAKTLRGTFGEPQFADCDTVPAACLEMDGVMWYLQQRPENEWQAESIDATREGYSPLYVDMIDWGDNLEAKAWREDSVVRVETVLYKTLDPPMLAFKMAHLYGQGPDEMWGTNTQTYFSNEATVYSHCARLTIQKLIGERCESDDMDCLAEYEWNSINSEWTGPIEMAVFNSAVWEGVEGPESPSTYSAEINVPGKVIYGFNWRVRKLHPDDPAGDYRITFSLDEVSLDEECDSVPLNTDLTDADIKPFSEEELTEELREILASEEEDGSDLEGGLTYVDRVNNLTYIDVRILPKEGGGKGGGGNGPGNGGGNGNKGSKNR